ncbi:hypothetical protein L915_13020 [Phytophthora nicotianae]|nr:hypothetical protein PPTG_03348 [Phytophthora nicotianae INRA-310]ETI41429.1 hypothetical protein F443_13332 [Phytophthora nicotianae P1569]ETK81482.1 hypothetical protein L915_13020 [Phytophthora nicotianae]ETO70067.1 hypothetical protein F444_13404 [Phytophthora nicotianae P1976]ETL34888.1 hypothetical protein L916_12925 [Phytophthora nicotianae]ETN20320.1 hypothetical protein PPTG_03348 [Phytophthora nicotianae INRA-310]
MKLQIQADENGTILDSKLAVLWSVATEWLKGNHVEGCAMIKNTGITSRVKMPV